MASAGVVPLTTAAPSYTFNPRSQGGSTADSPTAPGDANATVAGVTFNVESAAEGNASYYKPTVGNTSGTVSYTFTDTSPATAFTNLQVVTRGTIFAQAGYPGTITGTYLTSNGATGQFYSLDGSTNGLFDDNGAGGETDQIPITDDSTAVTIVYTITPTSGNTLGVQLFRSTGTVGTAGDYTFSATGSFVATPEPASLGLVAVSAGALLVRRRRR